MKLENLIETEDYRLTAKYREESIGLVQDYIDYAKHGPLNGVEFGVTGHTEEGDHNVLGGSLA